MTAEEFESTDNKYLFMEKKKFAEAYHKQEVEAITDDEIEKEFWINVRTGHWDKEQTLAKREGAKWFKNKLLKP